MIECIIYKHINFFAFIFNLKQTIKITFLRVDQQNLTYFSNVHRLAG